MDPTNSVFTTDVIDEALRQVLSDYTIINPLGAETVITLPGDGREIALSGVSGLLQVSDVWWPYDSDASQETWTPNRVRGWRLWWDDGAPVLFLDAWDGDQPQQNDELRLWYTKVHTIQNLDSASMTTVLGSHESMLVRGAAGLACLGRSADINETAANMAVSTPNYAALANLFLNDAQTGFYPWLYALRSQGQGRSEPFGEGQQLDKWDVGGRATQW